MSQPDPFFDLIDDAEWNACIGRQGDEENYADGYIEAAIELAKAVVEKKMYEKRDTLVLPILYNARHAIELTLKLVIRDLLRTGILANGHVTNHDIASHLAFLEGQIIGDEQIRETLSLLSPYVISLTKVDDDGQELRFHENRDGQRSIEDKALANIAVIGKSLLELQGVLQALKSRTYDLCREWHTGTWTTHCSRRDLIEIAKLLPQRGEWSSGAFDVAKKIVKDRYDLSDRKFSDALNKIQESRSLACIIGIEGDLAHLTEESAKLLLEQWEILHPPKDPKDTLGMDYFQRDFQEVKKHLKTEAEVAGRILAQVPEDQFADAETIFYIARNGEYPEQYELFLERKKSEFRARGDFRAEIHDLMSKTNFRRCFLDGLTSIGLPSLSSRLGHTPSE